MIEASPLWHAGILFFGLIVLLWSVWSGWKAGVVRALIGAAGLVGGIFFGWLAGWRVGRIFGGIDSPVGFLLGVGIILCVALLIWGMVCFFSAILFRRTDEQDSFLVRLVWGLGGGAVGVARGIVLLWVLFLAIRVLGAVGGGGSEAARSQDLEISGWAKALVALRESLEMGPSGKALESADLIPGEFYELLEKWARLAGDARVRERLARSAEVQRVMNHPRMVELTNYPGVLEAAARGRYWELLMNRGVWEAAMDIEFARLVAEVDWAGAIDEALAGEGKRKPD